MKNVGSRPPNVGDGSKAFFIAHFDPRTSKLFYLYSLWTRDLAGQRSVFAHGHMGDEKRDSCRRPQVADGVQAFFIAARSP